LADESRRKDVRPRQRDGRIVIMAAEKFHANATGVELDKELFRQSMDKIQSLRLQKTAKIINGDVLQQDYSSAEHDHGLPAPPIERQGSSDPRQAAQEGNAHRLARF